MRVSRRAEVYAQSLFSLSKDLEEDLFALSSAIEGEGQFFLSPLISKEEKAEAIQPVLEKFFRPPLTHFILVLIQENAIGLLPQTASAYHKLLLSFKGCDEAEVFSKSALTEEDQEGLKSALQPILGKRLLLKPRIDERSQGGILIRASDFVFNDTAEFHLSRILEVSS